MGTVTGLAALAHLQRLRFGPPPVAPLPPPPLPVAAQRILQAAPQDSLRALDGFRLLQAAGIPCAPFADIRTPGDIAAFAARHGLPIALKIDDPAIAHKSDLGGVELNLGSLAQAALALDRLRARHPGAPILAQAMGAGTEVILGMTTDPDFGPLVTLGLGGIFAEILRDSTALIPPFAPDQALRALQGLAGFALLTGARGRPPADLDALCRLIARFGDLAAGARGQIAEIEINPVLAGPQGAVAVDCITLRARKPHP